jgi:hypothetical protein
MNSQNSIGKQVVIEILEVRFVSVAGGGGDVLVYLRAKAAPGYTVIPPNISGWHHKRFGPEVGDVIDILDLHFADHINWPIVSRLRDDSTGALLASSLIVCLGRKA